MKRTILISALVLVCSIFLALPAWSATIIVPGIAPDGQPTIQAAIAASVDGDTILVKPGVYTELGQIVINKDVTIIGEGRPIIKPGQDTGSAGTAQGWWYVSPTGHLVLKDVILDGDTRQIFRGIYADGEGSIENCELRHMSYGASYGFALSLFNNWTVTHNFLWDIGRVGIHVNGAGTEYKITDNIYVGKGEGNWLDYGIEIERGAYATITNNVVSRCRGIVNADDHSAAIYASTFFPAATITTAILYDNTVFDNYQGLAVGYRAGEYTDTALLIAHGNSLADNDLAIDNFSTTAVDAEMNIWGTTDLLAIAAMVEGNVDFTPPSTLSAKGATGSAGVDGVDGADGADGSQGIQGIQGIQGAQGPIGLTGPTGPAGTTSWTDGTGMVTTGQRVGIGTLSPSGSSKLHIMDGTARIKLESTNNSANSALMLGAKGAAGTSSFGGLYYAGNETPANRFFSISADNYNYQLTVTYNGNIGVGTSTPAQKLEINGGVRLNTATAQPTCNATVGGTFWFTQGASGVKDTLKICAKDVSNIYAWRTLY